MSVVVGLDGTGFSSVSVPLIRCPDSPDEIVGCGKLTPDIRDDEGFVDCMNCGMFWLPELEVEK